MYIVKFLVVKTVGLPSSTAVLSQVQWWSVWLMVRCGPCSLRGPPAAATVAHVGTSLIPFANQRTPSSLLKRYWSFLQNPKKKDKEGPDKYKLFTHKVKNLVEERVKQFIHLATIYFIPGMS